MNQPSLSEIILGIIFILFFGIAFFLPFLLYGLAFVDLFISPLREKLLPRWYQFFPPTVNPQIPKVLSNRFEYYKRLNYANRQRFEQRLQYFIKTKEFIARDGMVLTDDMIILISASAIQITFGLKYFSLGHFHRIFIYPNVYHYKYLRLEFRGHVSDRGMIFLSWHHFEKGYLFPEDGINLGLHEMAHALKLQALEEEVDFDFYDNMESLKKYAATEEVVGYPADSIASSKRGDLDELWAVGVERFFEIPQKFRDELPELFQTMKKTLNQDPFKPSDPVINKEKLKE